MGGWPSPRNSSASPTQHSGVTLAGVIMPGPTRTPSPGRNCRRCWRSAPRVAANPPTCMSIHRDSPPSVLIQARAFTLGWRKTNIQQHSPKQEGERNRDRITNHLPPTFPLESLNVMQCPQYTCGKRQTLILVCLSLQGPGSLHQTLSNTGLLCLFYFGPFPEFFTSHPGC